MLGLDLIDVGVYGLWVKVNIFMLLSVFEFFDVFVLKWV